MSGQRRLPGLRFKLQTCSPNWDTGCALVSVIDVGSAANVCEESSVRDITDTTAELATECAVLSAHPTISRFGSVIP
jgi:hypothetical protein